MLIKATPSDLNRYQEDAYQLSLELSKSSFPTFSDGIKTKDDFNHMVEKAFTHDHSEILLFTLDNAFQGLIQYYWIPEDHYLGIEVFSIQQAYDEALEEFLNHIAEAFPGYKAYLGFPEENKRATTYLQSRGYLPKESSYVYLLHLEEFSGEKENSVVPITTEQFDEFRLLHDEQEEIYWNSDRLFEALQKKTKNPWHILGLFDKSGLAGSIYFTYYKEMMEIFGIDYRDKVFSKKVMKPLMKAALNKGKKDAQKHLIYFAREEEGSVLQEINMEYLCTYHLFVIDL